MIKIPRRPDLTNEPHFSRELPIQPKKKIKIELPEVTEPMVTIENPIRRFVTRLRARRARKTIQLEREPTR